LLLFLIQIYGDEKILYYLALQPSNFFAGNYWTILTSMFIHIEIWHLFANLISLYFIGNFLERIIGRKRIFMFYILSGIFAGLFYSFFSYYFGNTVLGARIFGDPKIYAVGASGAIFSLLGVLSVLTPYTNVYLIAGPIIAIILQVIIEKIFISQIYSIIGMIIYFYILLSILSIFSYGPLFKISLPIKVPFYALPIIAILPLVIISFFVQLPIGNSAHIGGLFAGLIYAYYLKIRYKKKTELIKRYFSRF